MIPFAERFWSKVDKSGSCWLWLGTLNTYGYGRFGRRGAHRIAYELTFGPIPTGMVVCHRCDNPPCCRPDHLFLGTDADNYRDSVAKGRQAWQKKPVPLAYRRMWVRGLRDGGLTLREIAFVVGVSQTMVQKDLSATRPLIVF